MSESLFDMLSRRRIALVYVGDLKIKWGYAFRALSNS